MAHLELGSTNMMRVLSFEFYFFLVLINFSFLVHLPESFDFPTGTVQTYRSTNWYTITAAVSPLRLD